MKITLFITILLLVCSVECRISRTRRVAPQSKPANKKVVAKAPQKSVPQPQKKYITITPYQARLEGVECNLCAQAATKILSHVVGIDTVQVALVNEDVEYATVNFVWHHKPDAFDVVAVNQALDKEGFEMTGVAAQKTVVTEIKV